MPQSLTASGPLALKRQRDQAKKQKKQAKLASAKQGGGGGFSLGDVVPDLGVGQFVKEIGAIPTGLIDLAAGKGGYAHGLSSFAKGLASSGVGTLMSFNPVGIAAPGTNKAIGEKVGDFLASNDAEDKANAFNPKSFVQKYQERGLVPAAVEDVGNISIVGGLGEKALKLGSVGRAAEAARLTEEASTAVKAAEAAGKTGEEAAKHAGPVLKKLAKAAKKAGVPEGESIYSDLENLSPKVQARLDKLKVAHNVAHPYQTIGNKVLRPLGKALSDKKLMTFEQGIGAAPDEAPTTVAEGPTGESFPHDPQSGRVRPRDNVPAAEWDDTWGPRPQVVEDTHGPYETAAVSEPLGGEAASRAVHRLEAADDALPEAELDYLERQPEIDGPYRAAASRARRAAHQTVGAAQAGSVAPSGSPLEQAVQEAVQAVEGAQASREAALRAKHAGEPTVTVYRGEPLSAQASTHLTGIEGDLERTGRWFSTDRKLAEAHMGEGGKLLATEVPESVARAAESSAGHVLPPEWAETARPLDEVAGDAVRAAEALPPEGTAPRIGPQRIASVAAQAATTPQWAEKVANRLPNWAVSAGAKGQDYLARHETRRVVREYEQFQESVRRKTVHDPAIQEAIKAAQPLMGKKLADGTVVGPQLASRMIGDAVIQHLTGTDLMRTAVESGLSNEPGIVDRIFQVQHAIPPELMTPELQAAIPQIAEQWRRLEKDRWNVMVGGRLATQGLEDISDVVMSASDKKLWRSILKDYERSSRLDAKIVRQRANAASDAGRMERTAARYEGQVQRLTEMSDLEREKVVSQADYLPVGLRDQFRPAHWSELSARAAADGAAIFDPHARPGARSGRIEAAAGDVPVIGMGATARTVPTEAFLADPAAVLDGVVADNASLLRHPDAKIRVTTQGDATVIDIAQNTVHGEPLTDAQAGAMETVRAVPSVADSGRSLRQIANALPDHPGETVGQARQRGARAASAAAKVEANAAKIRERTVAAAKMRTAANDIRRTIIEHTVPAEMEKAKLTGQVERKLDKLATSLDHPSNARTPASFMPMWGALKGLHKEAETNPQMAAVLEGMPEKFSTVLRIAAENGFDPVHVPSITEREVKSLVYDQVRLGKKGREGMEVVAGTRKTRTQPFARARSIEALAAGLFQATHEANSNAIVDYIEQVHRRPIPIGADGAAHIPPDFVVWDSTRRFILNGDKDISGAFTIKGGAQPKWMIPKGVQKAVDAMSRDYSHGAFGLIGKVTNPWRTVMLTLSPRWYVNNFVGNVALATVEGVRLRDWVTAWNSYRQRETRFGPRMAEPFADFPEVTGKSMMATEVPGEPNLIPYPSVGDTVADSVKGLRQGFKMAKAQGGITAGGRYAAHHLTRMNEVVDELARSAVYHRTIRTGGSAERALSRSYEALVDYGNLSPFERQVVRSVVPFYSWQKGMLKTAAKLPVEHPQLVAVLMGMSKLNEELNRDQYGVDLPEAYAGIVDVPGFGTINTRGFNPLQDANQLASPQGIAASLNPFLEIGLRNALGAPQSGFVDKQRVNEFGSLVPDTSPAQDVTEMATTAPQARFVESLAGASPVPGFLPSPAVGAERFAGISAIPPEQLAAIRARVLKSQARLAGSSGTPTKAKRRSTARPFTSPKSRIVTALDLKRQRAG